MGRNNWIILLFFTGLLIAVYPHVAQIVNNGIQKSQVQQFKQETELLPPKQVIEKVEAARSCNEAISKNEDGIHDPFTKGYNQENLEECKGSPLDGSHIASIEIPKLNLEIPIYLGATENELSKGIGQVEGSSLPVGGPSTHTVLAGHRGMGTKAMFRNLDVLKPGDTFYIYTLEEKLKYHVYDVEVILPHETENLQIMQDRDLASLVTCHPYRHNSHRLVVHGERLPN